MRIQNWKKGTASLLAASIILFALSGCGGKKTAEAPAKTGNPPAAAEQTTGAGKEKAASMEPEGKTKPAGTAAAASVEEKATKVLAEVLKENGADAQAIAGRVAATSYGHSEKGFLAYSKGAVWIVDLKNRTYGCINYPTYLGKIYRSQGKKEDGVAIFNMSHLEKEQNKDAELGKWEHIMHTIPCYVLYTFDQKGEPVLDDTRIFSATGTLTPSHYHAEVKEPKNAALAALAVTEAGAFLDQAAKHGMKFFLDTNVGKITGTEVRMRGGPGTEYKILGAFENGETVEILEDGNGWFKVRRKNGETGWVSADFCKKS